MRRGILLISNNPFKQMRTITTTTNNSSSSNNNNYNSSNNNNSPGCEIHEEFQICRCLWATIVTFQPFKQKIGCFVGGIFILMQLSCKLHFDLGNFSKKYFMYTARGTNKMLSVQYAISTFKKSY